MEGLIGILKDTALRSQKVVKLLVGYSRLVSEPIRNAYERERMVVEVEKAIEGFAPGEVRDKVQQWLDEESLSLSLVGSCLPVWREAVWLLGDSCLFCGAGCFRCGLILLQAEPPFSGARRLSG